RIDFALASLPLPIPFIQAGKMRGIGIMAVRRNPAVADVLTFQEQGFGSSQMISWSMVLLPAKTPKQIVEQVNAMFNKALQDPEVMQRLRTIHLSPADPMPWHEVQSLLATDAKRVAEIVKRAQVKAVN
ncbi:MAG TPA: tripartite tricarboxylate transporter substrate-binding protein, partial [Ramlibacter sp.]|nr:tripartite tricarboxylate transporter substrate-binding protein [Ramlibacter sp.]